MEGDVVGTKIGVVTESLTEEVAVCLTYAGFSNIRQERLSQFSFIILTRHFMYIWYILITGHLRFRSRLPHSTFEFPEDRGSVSFPYSPERQPSISPHSCWATWEGGLW